MQKRIESRHFLEGSFKVLNALKEKFNQYCLTLGVKAEMPTVPKQDGSAHIEFIDNQFHYKVTERGNEYEHRITSDENEALYWLISDLVFALATDFELKNRVPGQDFRRRLFSKEIELIEMLRLDWGARKRREIEKLVLKNPYKDNL